MKMAFKVYTVVLSALISSTLVFPAHAWTYRDDNSLIDSRTVPYKISLDSQTQSGNIEYRFYVRVLATQTGKSTSWSNPAPDDRQCSISVYGYGKREVCMNSILGGSSCSNEWSKDITLESRYTPTKGNFLDYDPCPDYHGQMDSMKREVSREVSAVVSSIIEEDLQQLEEQFSGRSVNISYDE